MKAVSTPRPTIVGILIPLDFGDQFLSFNSGAIKEGMGILNGFVDFLWRNLTSWIQCYDYWGIGGEWLKAIDEIRHAQFVLSIVG